jgi:hypothetical protein
MAKAEPSKLPGKRTPPHLEPKQGKDQPKQPMPPPVPRGEHSEDGIGGPIAELTHDSPRFAMTCVPPRANVFYCQSKEKTPDQTGRLSEAMALGERPTNRKSFVPTQNRIRNRTSQ